MVIVLANGCKNKASVGYTKINNNNNNLFDRTMYIEKLNDKQVRLCCLPNENTLLEDLVQINSPKQLAQFVQYFQEKGFEVIRRKFVYTNQKPTFLKAAPNYSEQIAFGDFNQSENYYLKFVK